jgi:uncharacterized protein (TIGR02646 family)
MIHFNRNTAPSCLTSKHKSGLSNSTQWGLEWEGKLLSNPKSKFNWRSYKGEAVNEILISKLRLLTNDHCCFCDKYAPEQDSDSIEHFQPKHIYPKAAYLWSNLFLCCTGCQKRAKGWKKYEHKQQLVLKPDVASYSFDKYFIFDTKTGNIKVNKFNTNSRDQERAELTIIYYQLNGFKRPQSRKSQFTKFYDSLSPNKIKDNIPLEEMAYRFIYH